MAKRQTALEKAIANIDDKIAALQLAREHLVAQQKASAPRVKKPRVAAAVAEG